VFSFQRPTAQEIEARIASVALRPQAGIQYLRLENGRAATQIPFLFAHDLSASVIGQGEATLAAARFAFERWSMFDLGWVRVANPQARIAVGQLIAVEAKTLSLWTLNVSRILEVIDTPHSFGFLYSPTELHVEEGEERFMLEFDPESQGVAYRVEAVSRPRSPLARLGLPITRMFQHHFARDSHRRMRETVLHCPK
jgi:uncharacterized protein (UPF0548 family)